MSTVISFRLDRDNPREARALAVLTAWQEAGYGVRHILTEALLRLEGKPDDNTSEMLAELREAIGQAQCLLAQIQSGGNVTAAQGNGDEVRSQLTDSFLASVKKAARPGMRMD